MGKYLGQTGLTYLWGKIKTLVAGKASTSDLATVATSGSYNDLSNTPTIPTVPANVSAFTNDAGYVESTAVTQIVSISQTAYDALATKDSTTLYLITS